MKKDKPNIKCGRCESIFFPQEMVGDKCRPCHQETSKGDAVFEKEKEEE